MIRRINMVGKKDKMNGDSPPKAGDRQYARRFQTNIDVRYLKNIRSFKDRIVSTYSCNQQQCPIIKDRLNQHQREHHAPIKTKDLKTQTTTTPERCCSPRRKTRDEAMAMSPTISRTSMSCKSNDHTTFQTAPSSQTEFSCNAADCISVIHNLENCNEKYNLNENFERDHERMDSNLVSSSSNEIPIKNTVTREVLSPKSNFYSEYVQNEVLEWLQDLPKYPNIDATAKLLRDKIVNSLMYNIIGMESFSNEINYEEILKYEIDASLNKLPIWLPVTKRDQNIFKDKLSRNLLKRIIELNNRVLINQNEYSNKYCLKQKTDDKEKTNTVSVDETKHVIENEIYEWLLGVKFQEEDNNKANCIKNVIELLLNRLTPLLNEPKCHTNYKLTMQAEIVELLNGLPICVKYPRNRMVLLNSLAKELADRLLSIRVRYNNSRCCSNNRIKNTIQQRAEEVIGFTNFIEGLKPTVIEEISNCLGHTKIGHNRELEHGIADLIIEYLELIRSGECLTITEEVCTILRNFNGICERQASIIAKNIIRSVKNVISEVFSNNILKKTLIQPQLSGIISVYTSEEIFPSNYPITSTPKKPTKPKSDILKLNPEEIGYMEKVAVLVREWMTKLPKQFNAPEDKGFKETIIYDLAGDIMSEMKLEQLVPMNKKEMMMKFIILRWLIRFNIFDDHEKCQKEIDELYIKVNKVPVPVMTRPQHGSRQIMDEIKFMANISDPALFKIEENVPKGIEVLEDEISIWMNEQPDRIYTHRDRSIRNKMIHELAEIIQDDLVNKKPEKEIQNNVGQWLNKVIKPDERVHIRELTEELKNRVKKLPQDETLRREHDEKIREKIERAIAKENARKKVNEHVSNSVLDEEDDSDKTMKEFISMFIQHNYDLDDPIARSALSYLLKRELQILSPPTRKEVYDNFTKSEPNARLSPERFRQELDYIKIISDWLSNMPIDPFYNKVGNKHRVEFVINIAKSIIEVEDEQRNAPEAMNYDEYLKSLIIVYIVQLPIGEVHRSNMANMATKLVKRINNYRYSIPQQRKIDKLRELGDFVDVFIREYGTDIGDDQVKLEVWTARIMKEIKKIVHETSDPESLCKTQIYSRLAHIPKPGDETVSRFNLELEYVKEISDWLKNLPLFPISNHTEEQKRARMIVELSEKMAEREMKKTCNPNDTQADTDFVQYVTRWIAEIPLDLNRPIDMAVVLQQLMNRMVRVNKLKHADPDLPPVQTSHYTNKKSPKPKSSNSKLKQDPGKLVIETVENFCYALPIPGDNENVIKTKKDDIARCMFQKIGELNIDPRIFNDTLLYKEMLIDEMDKLLENVLQNGELQKNKEKLKTNLIETIVEAKNVIKENLAGENYKQKLENTIEASIPNPVQSHQIYDPGFEIYKSRLATKFILDNFDHSSEAVKLKYETKIRAEIDKYFQCAVNKNAGPLTKDQIYNELYSALFKVPIPNEASIADEVEELKTRCEIDNWFEKLPLKEINGVIELLELDKILSTLAKRIHEIEKNKKNRGDKIHKEIAKWLVKLPWSSGNEGRINEFANKLDSALKSTADARKYVPVTRAKDRKNKGKKSKPLSKDTGPSNIAKTSTPPISHQLASSYQGPPVPHKKPADLILEVVQAWCIQLPLTASTPQEEENLRSIKENLVTKIILKISELNANPEIFADDIFYAELLDNALEKMLSVLPTCCEFQQSKEIRKIQLQDAIKSIKPLIREERARHDYKQELKTTVVSLLEEPRDKRADNVQEYQNFVDKVVEEFVQYKYNEDDEEGRQYYKMKVHDAVVKYFDNIAEKNDKPLDTLLTINQLICELSKIPLPSKAAVKEEVEEIRMKNEVSEFFEELSIPDQNFTLINQVKTSLAKRLFDLEKNGHNNANDSKMTSEIIRCLKKLNIEVAPQIVDAFMNKLKSNEIIRKAPSPKDMIEQAQQVGQGFGQAIGSALPQHDPRCHKPLVIQGFRPRLDEVKNPEDFGGGAERNLRVSAVAFSEFEAGVALNSSFNEQGPIRQIIEVARRSILTNPRPAVNTNQFRSELINQVPQTSVAGQARVIPSENPQILPGQSVPLLAMGAIQVTVPTPCVQTCPRVNLAIEDPLSGPSSGGAPLTLQVPSLIAPSGGSSVALPTEPSAPQPETVLRIRRPNTPVSSDPSDNICRCGWKRLRYNRCRQFCTRRYYDDHDVDYRFMSPMMYRMPIRGFFFF